MVDTTPALKAEPWYRAWQRAGGGASDVVIARSPRSTHRRFPARARAGRLPRTRCDARSVSGGRALLRRWRAAAAAATDGARRRRRRALGRRHRDRAEPVGRRREQRSGVHDAVAEQREAVAGRARDGLADRRRRSGAVGGAAGRADSPDQHDHLQRAVPDQHLRRDVSHRDGDAARRHQPGGASARPDQRALRRGAGRRPASRSSRRTAPATRTRRRCSRRPR